MLYTALFDYREYAVNLRPASGYHGAYPGYHKSTKLDGLYLWLTSLGYQMSDEEKALQDGTHELYHMKDPEEKVKTSPEEDVNQK